METGIVFKQMCVIFIFILIGYALRKKEMISDIGVRDITWIIVNICNPALILSAVMNTEKRPDMASALQMMGITAAAYCLMILLGFLIGPLVRAPKKDWKFYNMMTVFGNTGFIGLPLAQAVLGSESLIYIAIFILAYNLLIYTYGVAVIRGGEEQGGNKMSLKALLNPGTISSLAALILFFTGAAVPDIISTACRYMSNSVTFLAVTVIGASLAGIEIRTLFNDPHLYVFVIIRQIIFPVLFTLLLKNVIQNELLVASTAIVISVPVGNMPVMLAKLFHIDTDLLTRGTVFTTLLSVLTITIVSLAV